MPSSEPATIAVEFDKQRPAELRVGMARALGQQPRALGDADQRAGGVEDLDQHEDEDHVEDPVAERAEEVELQEGRRDRRRRRHDAAELAHPEQDRDHGDREDADQDRALDLQRVERAR